MSGFDGNDFGDQADLAGILQRGQQSQDLAAIRAELERQKSLPQCPHCGGRLEGQFEKCKHCRSTVVWVEGIPCKPGEEGVVRKQLDAARETRQRRQEGASHFQDEIKEERSKHETTDGMAAVLYVLMWGVAGCLFTLPFVLGLIAKEPSFVCFGFLGAIVFMVIGGINVWEQSKDELDFDKKRKTGIYLDWRNMLRRS